MPQIDGTERVKSSGVISLEDADYCHKRGTVAATVTYNDNSCRTADASATLYNATVFVRLDGERRPNQDSPVSCLRLPSTDVSVVEEWCPGGRLRH